MGFRDWFGTGKNKNVNEAIKEFVGKDEKVLSQKEILAQRGEGFEDIYSISGFGQVGLSSFNIFYNRYINQQFQSERARIFAYRSMAEMTEIADIIEDATNESTQEDSEGNIIHLEILDKNLMSNDNIVKNIYKEFNELFYERIDICDKLWDMFRTYMVDGRVFFENIIDVKHPEKGIINIKKLPSETMDFEYDPITSKNTIYYQYIAQNPV